MKYKPAETEFMLSASSPSDIPVVLGRLCAVSDRKNLMEGTLIAVAF
jgi:hypothetical protein